MQDAIIDWELSIKLAGNDINHAKTYLNLLGKELRIHLENINQFLINNNHIKLRAEIHQILGALCYCGATRLKQVTTELHSALKTNTDTSALLILFKNETNTLIDFIENTAKHPIQFQ